jgi:hypothetical protein
MLSLSLLVAALSMGEQPSVITKPLPIAARALPSPARSLPTPELQRPLPSPERTPAEPRVRYKTFSQRVQTAPLYGPGWHRHKCPTCGYVWSHSSNSFGNPSAHTCPACGRAQSWYHYNGPSPVRTITKTVPFIEIPPVSKQDGWVTGTSKPTTGPGPNMVLKRFSFPCPTCPGGVGHYDEWVPAQPASTPVAPRISSLTAVASNCPT